MKILVADDNRIERLILRRILENFNHEVILAEDGERAIELFRKEQPQMVLLDVLMPIYTGYEVAKTLKKDSTAPWFPIIFLTSLTEAQDLAKCIDVGGDDFLSKPINETIIKAKLDSFERILNLYDTVNQQQKKIQIYNEHLLQEQEAAKVIFDNIVHKGCLEEDNINYHLSPMSIFNGDLMLSANLPGGGMRMMLADFTGHGLPAAIGSMPASEIFYGMTNKGFSIEDVMMEMNRKLYDVLPIGVFCCVIIFDLDSLTKRITFWNAGAPDCYLVDTQNEKIELLSSTHLAIGILSPQSFKIECQSFPFTSRHKIIAATDGIMEAEAHDQAMFGEQRILEFIENNIHSENICDDLILEVERFCGSSDQSDDLSLVEVGLPTNRIIGEKASKAGSASKTGISDSKLSLQLRRSSLGSFDPVPFFLQALLSCSELNSHRARIFTLLSELYNNALDHGVLGLDSDLKNGSNGFARYYELRSERLAQLDDGYVTVTVDLEPTELGGSIAFEIIDTGKGFNVKKTCDSGSKNYSGRGLPLIHDLCKSVTYNKEGNQVVAVYSWDNEIDPAK